VLDSLRGACRNLSNRACLRTLEQETRILRRAPNGDVHRTASFRSVALNEQEQRRQQSAVGVRGRASESNVQNLSLELARLRLPGPLFDP